MSESALEREQESFDLLQPCLGFLFRQAREFAAERDEFSVAHFDTAPVAQVCNLPYRRFAIGGTPISR